MTRSRFLPAAAAALLALAAPTVHAQDAGQINVICSVQAEWCNMIQTVFARTTGIKVNMSLKGSGEALAQIMLGNHAGVPYARGGPSVSFRDLLDRMGYSAEADALSSQVVTVHSALQALPDDPRDRLLHLGRTLGSAAGPTTEILDVPQQRAQRGVLRWRHDRLAEANVQVDHLQRW